MLENERYNRAIRANSRKRDPQFYNLQVYLDYEYRTQTALKHLGVDTNSSPSNIPNIDRMVFIPKWLEKIKPPYCIEILGMPHSGKSSGIDNYLRGLWINGQRDRFLLSQEGVRSVPEKYKYLKYTDPFAYSMLGGTISWIDVFEQTIKSGLHFEAMLGDREQFDRRIFRKSLFIKGEVNPKIMEDESFWEYGLETSPIPVKGVVMCLIRPEVSLQREGPRKRPGSVMNEQFLKILYEQYLTSYYEAQYKELPAPCFVGLNMECPIEEARTKLSSSITEIVNASFTH